MNREITMIDIIKSNSVSIDVSKIYKKCIFIILNIMNNLVYIVCGEKKQVHIEMFN